MQSHDHYEVLEPRLGYAITTYHATCWGTAELSRKSDLVSSHFLLGQGGTPDYVLVLVLLISIGLEYIVDKTEECCAKHQI